MASHNKSSYFRRFIDWVDEKLPSPHVQESDRYKEALNDVHDFWKEKGNKALEVLDVELTKELLEHARSVWEDSESDRDRMAQRTDKILLVIGVIAGGKLLGGNAPLELWGWFAIVSLMAAAGVALLARRSFGLISPMEPIDALNRAVERDNKHREYLALQITTQLQRAVACNRAVNEWTAKVLSLATVLTIAGISFAVISIAKTPKPPAVETPIQATPELRSESAPSAGST